MAGLNVARFLAQLAGSLGDFGAPQVDEALQFFLEEAGKVLRAENNLVAICVRDHPLNGASPVGWRPVWDVRHGPDSSQYTARFRDWYADPSNFPSDGTVVAIARTAGMPRAFLRQEMVSDDEWQCSPVQELFDDLSIGDRLLMGVPVSASAEMVLTAYRGSGEQPFSPEDREVATLVATAIQPFCRRLALSYGFGTGLIRLTPRERSVLMVLLTGVEEKEGAHQLSLTPRSFHQYVVSVYRKIGVSSRAELMAQFLSAGSLSQEDTTSQEKAYDSSLQISEPGR